MIVAIPLNLLKFVHVKSSTLKVYTYLTYAVCSSKVGTVLCALCAAVS